MQTLVHHCKYNHSSSPLNSFDSLHHRTLAKTQSFCTPFRCCTTRVSIFSKNNLRPLRRNTHFSFCSKNDGLQNEVAIEDESLGRENAELGLLDKPFPIPRDEAEEPSLEVSEEERVESVVNEEEALAPFLKFFNQTETEEGASENEPSRPRAVLDLEYEVENRVGVEYYDPKAGDFAVGVVVSGNENKLDVHVGADLLGTMLTKEVLPLYGKEIEFLRCDPGSEAGDFSYAPGRMGVVGYGGGEPAPVDGRPVVEPGTVLFAEVLGRTLSGRPLLSCRRLFRRISWHRLRQIQQLNEPIEVRITEWNTGGLLTRLEGLRAFIPKAELMKRINNFSELKEKVGSSMRVLITRINDEKNDLILSEKEAWQMSNLREGALLEGTVRKVFPYGVQIRIGKTNRSGLLHISNISKDKISSVKDLFAVGDKVKVLVVKSMFPDKISLSIAELESEPGLFLSDKERVFSEAEMMAKKFRANLPGNMTTERSKSGPIGTLAFENEAEMYANWKWFKFERDHIQTDS